MKIFVASSGRCGTGFLYEGFRRYTNIGAYHEESPVIKGPLLRAANSYKENSALGKKASLIAKRSWYIDTAHQFMRGFYPYVLEKIPTAQVIKLARDPLEVARSRLNRGVVPGRSPWVGHPDDERNIIKLSREEWDSLSDLQKVLWDWIEHEERFDQIKEQFVQVVYLSFVALTKNTHDTFKRIFEELGIYRYQIDTIDLRKNSNAKLTVVHPGDQEELDQLVSLMRSKGHALAWLDTAFYQRVVKRHDMYQREFDLLPHYNKNVAYTSVDPTWALKKFPIQLKPRMRVLDLGCGDGRWARYIKEVHGCTVVGVDFSAKRIQRARELSPGIQFHCDNVYDFVEGYKGPKFDYTLMVEVLEHLENPEGLLRGLRRISKNLIGTTPKNFPYVAHLQVYKTAKEFRSRFPEWDLKTRMGSMSPGDTRKNVIYFHTSEK